MPGTEDYDRAVACQTIVHHDVDDDACTDYVTTHPLLSRDELRREYADAFRYFVLLIGPPHFKNRTNQGPSRITSTNREHEQEQEIPLQPLDRAPVVKPGSD